MSTPDGNVCSSADQGDPNIYCLTRGQSIGLALTAESGSISLIAVFTVFVLIVRNVRRQIRMSAGTKGNLIKTPLDAYMLSLFTSDIIQALGAVMDIKWVHEGKVYTGSFCSAQGAIQQLGETGVAMMTFVIAVHTCLTIVWRKWTHSLAIAFFIIAFIWVFVILFVAIGPAEHNKASGPYITPTPYWCWIGANYLGERIAGEYVWLWLTLATSIIVYVPLSLWSRGNLAFEEGRVQFHWRRQEINIDEQKADSLAILAYPLAYAIVVLPLSIVRWISFVQEEHGRQASVASVGTFIVIIIYGLSGFVNVVLLRYTRPELLLFNQVEAVMDHGRAPSIMSSASNQISDTEVHPSDTEAGAAISRGRLNESNDSGFELSQV